MLNEQTEFTGIVHQGVVVLDPPATLPEGQSVKIIVENIVEAETQQAEALSQPPEPIRKAASPVGEMLMKFAGVIDDLPSDMAKNHDHYLYGAPKREE